MGPGLKPSDVALGPKTMNNGFFISFSFVESVVPATAVLLLLPASRLLRLPVSDAAVLPFVVSAAAIAFLVLSDEVVSSVPERCAERASLAETSMGPISVLV